MNQYNPYPAFNPYLSQASINALFPAQTAQNGMTGNVLRVSGINGVNALNIAPNSSVLALDDTAPILWYIQTDSAGYKTPTAYDIMPHVEQAVKTENDFEIRLKSWRNMSMNNNPVLNQMQAAQSVLNPQMIAQIKGIAKDINSPQMQLVRQITTGRGITPRQAVEMLCRQQGIDPNSFMAQINSAFNGQ